MLRFACGAACGFGLAVALLVILRLAVASVQSGDTVDEALVLVAADYLQTSSNIEYVGTVHGDFSEPRFKELERLASQAEIHPYSARPSVEDTCDDPLPKASIRIGACMKDDYVRVAYLDNPLWHVARIGVETAACGGKYVLVRWFGRWRILDGKLTCT